MNTYFTLNTIDIKLNLPFTLIIVQYKIVMHANYILMLCVFITYQFLAYGDIKRGKKEIGSLQFKGGFKSEEAGGFLHCQDKYSKSLS